VQISRIDTGKGAKKRASIWTVNSPDIAYLKYEKNFARPSGFASVGRIASGALATRITLPRIQGIGFRLRAYEPQV
jgi:hypothetical protein